MRKLLTFISLQLLLLSFSPQAKALEIQLNTKNSTANKELIDHYLIELKQEFEAQWILNPPKQSSTAKLSFLINVDGSISNLKIIEATGDKTIAVNLVKGLAPYSEPPLRTKKYLDIEAQFSGKVVKAKQEKKQISTVVFSQKNVPSKTTKSTNKRSTPTQSERSLSLEEARKYGLALINRDRVSKSLKPVSLDSIASKAAQMHSDEMAKYGYSAHWNPDGMKPPQRYTICGGLDYVMENSMGMRPNGGWQISKAKEQLFSKKDIEEAQSIFFNEKPPNDGHRRNILKPAHTHVGLGYTLLSLYHKPTGTNAFQIACAQEFINKYGNYTASDKKLNYNKLFVLEGKFNPGTRVHSAQILQEPLNKKLTVKEILTSPKYSGGYGLPSKRILAVFPSPYSHTSEAKLFDKGSSFRLEIKPNSSWQPSLYYILLWANTSKNKSRPDPVSMIVLPLEKTVSKVNGQK